MKRFAFIFTSLLVLSFGLVNAQSGSVTFTVPTVMDGVTPSVQTDAVVSIGVRFTHNYGQLMTGSTNGVELSGPDGASWVYTTDAINGAVPTGAILTAPATMYDGGFFVTPASLDGTGADTMGLGGFALFAPGIPDGFDEVVATIDVQFSQADVGLMFCVDSAFYQPSNSWTWSIAGGVGGQVPDVFGNGCWPIYKIPNLPPEITNCPGAKNYDHCDLATFDFDASDPEGDAYTFNLASGVGSIDAGSGVWSYAPSLADVGVSMAITVNASDAFGTGGDCDVDLSFSNEAPALTGGCGDNVFVGMGNQGTHQMAGSSVDCDPFTYSMTVSPAPVGAISIDANTGLITFDTDSPGDGGVIYTVTVTVSDGTDESSCDMTFEVLRTEPFAIQIEKTHMTFQGGHETVDITFNAGSETLGGFDFLIAYDASALTFVGALEGSIYSRCGWEYFTFRYGANGNCSGGCPSGLLRVIGIAETNNGANHPSCFDMEVGDTFATLDFLVTDDRTLECQYVPIRFFWLDCGDNTLSSETGDTLFISRFVYDFDLIGEISDASTGYPTYMGAQDADCFTGDPEKVPARFIDFFNGGIDIACADSIDARGDINLNEIPNEIADAVLFSNYFIYGLGVFTINLQGQIAASDVNADGLSLSVADLVYMIRVIVGDALPYDKVSPISASWSHSDNVVSVDGGMGAAHLVVSGNVVPTLLADGMEMKYNFDGANTRILVYSEVVNASFSGDFLNVNGNIVSIEMASYDGAPVVAKAIPATYALKQNYPNPFNPTTKIEFNLENSGKYILSIYNVTGRKVAEFTDFSEAGSVEVVWDAAGMASGIYFYQLEANNFSATKKMVLLK